MAVGNPYPSGYCDWPSSEYRFQVQTMRRYFDFYEMMFISLSPRDTEQKALVDLLSDAIITLVISSAWVTPMRNPQNGKNRPLGSAEILSLIGMNF